MFYLQDVPNLKTLTALKNRYPEFEPLRLMCCVLLMRAGSDILALADKLFREFGLSQGGFLTILVLNRDPAAEYIPSELSAKVGVTRATMTGLLDTLTKAGLIERVQHAGDRRKLVVRLTNEGRKRMDHFLPRYMPAVTRLIPDLSEKEQKTFIKLLEKVSAGFKTRMNEKATSR